MRVISAKEMRSLEAMAVNCGVSLETLMDNAGKALADFISTLDCGKKITFLAGCGNNGGDCFVAAEELIYRGFDVTIVNLCGSPQTVIAEKAFGRISSERVKIVIGYKSEAARMALEKAEIDFMSNNGDEKLEQIMEAEKMRIARVYEAVKNADIVVDGVFGTGFHGKIDKEIAEYFELAENAVKIAADVPSGGDCTSGSVTKGAFNADYTVTFGCVKSGMTQYPLKKFCGEIILKDIGIPEKAFEILNGGMLIETTEDMEFSKLLRERQPDSHKGDFGRLLVIAGSEKMRGACALATEAALRCGVGMVCTASTESALNAVSVRTPESLLLPLEYDFDGFMLYDSNMPLLESEIKKADAVLIGCGMGVTTDTKAIVTKIIETADCPIIIDADGLNCIASDINILQKKKADIILTPHPMEMSRLASVSVAEVQADRINTALSFAEKYGVTVVLKGAGTVTAQKDGCIVNTTGNSGMSKGGSGDVLAGIIASLTAQGYDSMTAAALGAYIHGLSGDIAAEKIGVEAMLPSDLIKFLPDSFRCLKK